MIFTDVAKSSRAWGHYHVTTKDLSSRLSLFSPKISIIHKFPFLKPLSTPWILTLGGFRGIREELEPSDPDSYVHNLCPQVNVLFLGLGVIDNIWFLDTQFQVNPPITNTL